MVVNAHLFAVAIVVAGVILAGGARPDDRLPTIHLEPLLVDRVYASLPPKKQPARPTTKLTRLVLNPIIWPGRKKERSLSKRSDE